MIAWRVLLAEDEAVMAQIILEMLAELPVEVSLAKTGREALEKAQANPPDLILLDASMPELDGFEVVAALKADPVTQGIPIVFMAARARVEDKVRVLELGVDDYLVKPIRQEELLARVKNTLRRGEAQRAVQFAEISLMRGSLEMVGLPSILQVLETERKTGMLYLSSANRRGEMRFTGGILTSAREGPRLAEAAVYSMLTWKEGEFALEPTAGVAPPEAQVSQPNQTLILEAARRQDEIPSLRQAVNSLAEPASLLSPFREWLLDRALPAGWRWIVEACDGTRTLSQVLEDSSLDEWGTLEALVRFHQLGLLADRDRPSLRSSPRLGIQVPVDFQILKAFRVGSSSNLSAGGMCLHTTQVLPVGSEILVRFQLPGIAQPFKALSRIIWSSPTDTPEGLPAGMGIQFLDLTSQEQGTIERYIVEHLVDQALKEPREEG